MLRRKNQPPTGERPQPLHECLTGLRRNGARDVVAQGEIEVEQTHEAADAPRIGQYRYAALQLATHVDRGQVCQGFVLYDCLLSRIEDGVFLSLSDALWVAAWENCRVGPQRHRRAPNGAALGLIYPTAVDMEEARRCVLGLHAPHADDARDVGDDVERDEP